MLLSGRAKLGRRALVRNLTILTGLAFGMIYVNGALSVYGTNFMYLVRPPLEGLPYLNLESGWYAYFLRLIALGAAIVTVFHLPFLVRERRGKKEREAAR